ncbi:MAG: hypothetical protein HY788_23435 [Deltaproteobacteria bacterium]|nr:hypothetical protein [Deltaproteobacteria bacterium]
MHPGVKLLLRVVLALAASLFLTHVFLKSDSWYARIGLACLLLIMAYTMEAVRKRKD